MVLLIVWRAAASIMKENGTSPFKADVGNLPLRDETADLRLGEGA